MEELEAIARRAHELLRERLKSEGFHSPGKPCGMRAENNWPGPGIRFVPCGTEVLYIDPSDAQNQKMEPVYCDKTNFRMLPWDALEESARRRKIELTRDVLEAAVELLGTERQDEVIEPCGFTAREHDLIPLTRNR